MYPFPTDINSFALFLATPAAVGVVQAYLLELLPFWKTLSPQHKRLGVFALSLALPYVAAGLLVLIGSVPAEQVATVQYLLNLAIQGLVVWVGSQKAHELNELRG